MCKYINIYIYILKMYYILFTNNNLNYTTHTNLFFHLIIYIHFYIL